MMRYPFLAACSLLALTAISSTAAAGPIECNRQTQASAEDKKRAGTLIAAMSKATTQFKSLNEDQKTLLYAQGIETWRLLGKEGLRDHMEISAFAGMGLRTGPKGLEKNVVLGKQLTDHAKQIASFIVERYQNRGNTTGPKPTPPAVPAHLPAAPPEQAAQWARRIGGFNLTKADAQEEATTRYCNLLAKARSGESVGEEASWAIAFEKKETNYTGNDTPPLWRAALMDGKAAQLRAEAARKERARQEAADKEQRARQAAEDSEKRARQAKQAEQRRKYAAQLAEQAKKDRVLSQSETNVLCDFYGDLCQRQLQVQRYQSCFFVASERASSNYSGAVRSGQRPTDGTWSGTYRQIEADYQRQCQALKPPGYRGR